MQFDNYRLIISDLDGTLVAYGSDRVSPNVKTTIHRLQEQGILFTIATGRSWKQTRSIARELGVTVPVILQAGAIVFDPQTERVIRQIYLRHGIDEQLREILDGDDIDQFCLDEGGAYYASNVNTQGGKWLHERSGEPCFLGAAPTGPVVKHFFTGPEHSIKRLAMQIHQTIKPKPNMILWPPDQETYDWSLEIFDPAASKGQALQWLAPQLAIRLKQILAFGDGFNDLDMLQYAGLGVAMEEAPDLVRIKSDFVIPGPEKEGIVRFLNGEIAGSSYRKPLFKRFMGAFFSNSKV
jgi:Cof subfamily protein (haloacid dehalogenase superfamily)